MTPVSVCLATHEKPLELARTLDSIFAQGADCEVVVVDDGSADDTPAVARRYPVVFERIDRPPGYRNSAVARNRALRLATADVLILQSDDVAHGPDAVRRLADPAPGTFQIATVWNTFSDGGRGELYTGAGNPRPLFFLGSVRREDVYAVGGNDEEFVEPGYEDNWFGDCLMLGRRLRPVFRPDVEGYHQHHARPADLHEMYARSGSLYLKKVAAARAGGRWEASGGPWPFTGGPTSETPPPSSAPATPTGR